MADNNTGAASVVSGPAPTMQMYKEEQARLRTMLDRRNQLARRIAAIEADIESKENTYLDSTPYGNIIAGFDNYIKGTSGSGAQRRKQGNAEQNRVFSRSSISYRPGSEATTPGGSTPASHAPTPQSASFKENGATSASTTASKGGSRKKKQNEEDSEAEPQAPNKKRINFGASRK
ncbi:NuA4-domain-containing protein [Sodiomyces alkalinus F11]|uniref:Chromatin modification-related protein EAF6 n=1 Tax=Sodiomyces alkalinus (strain CBS 110278 / VKM F-3762 / F11) TaxID=1314773 RepID=A0A3N2PSC5_SODAK|nr:NuA4-domain-containing protein [Sodiomyces alkalinus F11]ROT37405.1 NuA4-domain-containing protein [Sodiomyces alkalinus F11]